MDSPNASSKLVFSNPCLINHIAFSSCAAACGVSLALAKESSEEVSPVLRISVTSDSDVSIHFQLEGKLIGPWVEELRQLSDTALLRNKTITLDLKKLWFTDLEGAGLLRELHQRQVSQINCSQFITQQLLAVHQPTMEEEVPAMIKTSEKARPLENQAWSRNARGANVTKTDSVESFLIHRVINGDIECFYELVRPYERAIFLAALSLVRNEADAEDIVQEAVLKAFKGLRSFRQEAKFSTWLIQITLNEAKMRLRKDRPYLHESIEEGERGEDGDYIPKDFADWREIPSEALEQKELREALIKALNSLPEKYRTVFVLRDVQQLSIAETVQALGISEASVKTRLSRARLKMRDTLATSFWVRFSSASGIGNSTIG
ncbi:MAG TPA: sigma-70 family RNA polymerase sigma factor [Candidatus Acidoferrales bacterium]|nr:sigma-70 family RNA polymerase sigma factor [Candidatus Acidoferrales bacterium]